jgi:hypothetical protein
MSTAAPLSTAPQRAAAAVSVAAAVRLYLVLSVVFFIWVSASQSKLQVVQLDSERGAPAARVSTPFDPALPGESAQQRTERLCRDAVYQGRWLTIAKLLVLSFTC